MIYLDRSARSVVVGCGVCGCREVFAHESSADLWARDHLARAHPEPSLAKNNAIQASNRRVSRRRDTPGR